MPWELDNDRPIYLQLMERIQQDIVSGVYHAGDKLPSVRDLAIDAAVNPDYDAKSIVRTGAERTFALPADQRAIYYGG